MLNGLNHLTLTVTDLGRSVVFYESVLGMTLEARWNRGAYFSCGSLWFCLSLGKAAPSSDYSHIAFNVSEETFPAFKKELQQSRVTHWQENSSEGDSMYILDPDGHKLEIHVGSLESRLESLKNNPYDGLQIPTKQ